MPPLGIDLKGTKARTQRDSCIPTFTAALFTKAKTLSVHQQVNKENTTHPPHTHTPHTHRSIIQPETRTSDHLQRRGGPSEHSLREVSRTEKDKYCDITYTWKLKKPNSQKQSRAVAKNWGGVGRGAVRGTERCWSKDTSFRLSDE